MVRIDRVVTRGGDGGETSLGDGTRVRKDDARVEAYGTVDEANAAIGILRLFARENEFADAILKRVQNDLFDIGADLCVPGEMGDRLRVSGAMTERLGTPAAAHAHLARTIVRRAERRVVMLALHEAVNPEVIRALNRLSDLLFVLGRHLNGDGGDVLWVPGGGG
jgi:cob(I)alamin adenosyltransferase